MDDGQGGWILPPEASAELQAFFASGVDVWHLVPGAPYWPGNEGTRVMDGDNAIWVWRAGKWIGEPQADAMTVVEVP